MKIDIEKIKQIAKEAGKAILKIYKTDFEVHYKKGETFEEGVSPLTKADTTSNKIIVQSLREIYPLIPILSEENKAVPYKQRKRLACFWLIDPLDGTKEFIKRNGEFTVNIALIKDNKPLLGVVYVPVKDIFYYADYSGAFKQVNGKKPIKLPLKEKRNKLVIVASKNHMNDETLNFINELKKDNEVQLISVGSSLKLCLVAEGKADIYPRIGPTMEWDTAAAHAIVKAAGKKVLQYGKNEELIYNKENLLNPSFIVK